MSDFSQGPGWWQASDGKWYPPEQAPAAAQPPAAAPAPGYGAPPAYGAPGAMAMGGAAGMPGPLASWGQRVVAYLIDYGIALVGYIAIVIVSAIFGAVSDALGAIVLLVGWLAMAGYGFYIAYLNGEVGASPGKRLTGLKVVNMETGQLIGGGQGIVRMFAHILDSLVCGLGYLLPLVDDKRQTIADKVMKTVVLSDQPKMAFGPEILKK